VLLPSGLWAAGAENRNAPHEARRLQVVEMTLVLVRKRGLEPPKVSIREVQKILGHSSVTTTERYAHLCAGHLLREIEAVELDLSQRGVVVALHQNVGT